MVVLIMLMYSRHSFDLTDTSTLEKSRDPVVFNDERYVSQQSHEPESSSSSLKMLHVHRVSQDEPQVISIEGSNLEENHRIQVNGSPCRILSFCSTLVKCRSKILINKKRLQIKIFTNNGSLLYKKETFLSHSYNEEVSKQSQQEERSDQTHRILQNIKSGAWSDPESWKDNRVPNAKDTIVVIPQDQQIILNSSTPVIQHLRIYGELTFDDTLDNLTLNAKIIEIMPTGKLTIGSESMAYSNKAQIVLHGSEDDPFFFNDPDIGTVRAAIINRGQLEIYGKENDNDFELQGNANKGDTQIKLRYYTNPKLEKGNQLILSSAFSGDTKIETVSIRSIQSNQIILKEPLKNYHFSRNWLQEKLSLLEISSELPRTRVFRKDRNISISGSINGLGCTIINAGSFTNKLYATKMVIKNVKITNCGQLRFGNPALRVSNVEESEVNIKDNIFLDLSGSGIKVENVQNNEKIDIRSNLFFDVTDSAIEIKNCKDMEIKYNYVLLVKPKSSDTFGFGIKIAEGFVNKNINIFSNEISCLGHNGIGMFSPGVSCITLNNKINRNKAIGCDIGWLGRSGSLNDCLSFGSFTSIRSKVYGFIFIGNTKHLEINNMVFLHNKKSMMFNFGSAEESDPSVKIRDSYFLGFNKEVIDLLDENSSCLEAGIITPSFSIEDYPDELSLNVSQLFIPNSVLTNPGVMVMEKVVFKDFQNATFCEEKVYPVLVNPFPQSDPVKIYLNSENSSDFEVDQFIKFPERLSLPTVEMDSCANQKCLGNTNTFLIDVNNSLIKNSEFNLVTSEASELLDDQVCKQYLGSSLKICTFKVKLKVQEANQARLKTIKFAKLLPKKDGYYKLITLSRSDSKYFSGFVKPFKEYSVIFDSVLEEPVSFELETSKSLEWIFLEVMFKNDRSISVYKEGFRVDSLIDGVDKLEFSNSNIECGRNWVDYQKNTLNFILTNEESCKLFLNFEYALQTSIVVFGGDIGTLFLIKPLVEDDLSSLNVSFDFKLRRVYEIENKNLYFCEIRINNSPDQSKARDQLESVYCSLSDQLKALKNFYFYDSIGTPFWLMGDSESPSSVTKCDPVFHDSIQCLYFEVNDRLSKCLQCRDNYTMSEATHDCFPKNCRTPSRTNTGCTECWDGFWLDRFYYNSCKKHTDVEHCVSYSGSVDSCSVCTPGKRVKDNFCVDMASGDIFSNCLYYDTRGKCLRCEEGFFLFSADECKQYSKFLNCAEFNPLEDRCISCPPEHRLSGFRCKDVAGCLQFGTDQTSCTECKSDYFLDEFDQTCIHYDFKVDKCKLYWYDNSCQECTFMHTLKEERCVVSITAVVIIVVASLFLIFTLLVVYCLAKRCLKKRQSKQKHTMFDSQKSLQILTEQVVKKIKTMDFDKEPNTTSTNGSTRSVTQKRKKSKEIATKKIENLLNSSGFLELCQKFLVEHPQYQSLDISLPEKTVDSRNQTKSFMKEIFKFVERHRKDRTFSRDSSLNSSRNTSRLLLEVLKSRNDTFRIDPSRSKIDQLDRDALDSKKAEPRKLEFETNPDNAIVMKKDRDAESKSEQG